MSVTAAQAIANYQSNPNIGPQTLIDSAANVAANLDGLVSLAAANDIVSISLTNSGTPTLTITASQATNDGNALAEIATPFTITVADTAANLQTSPHLNSLQVQANLPLVREASSIPLGARMYGGGGRGYWICK